MGHHGLELSQARLLMMLGANFTDQGVSAGFNQTPVSPHFRGKKVENRGLSLICVTVGD